MTKTIASKISAVVNTRNEAANIADCLKTLTFADEIIVVDMESTDDTKEIAKQFTDRIFDHPAVGYVEPARNFAIKKTIGDWVLIVDADERIPKTLARKLIDIAQERKVDFVRIPRKNIVFGQWVRHSRWWPDHNIRFFKKGSVEWQNEIHSVPITYGTGETLNPDEALAITHYHYKSIDEFIERSLRYSRQQAKELKEAGYEFEPSDLITKPASEFLSRFFAGEGYRDGLHGLSLSLLQAWAILLIYLRLWQEADFKIVSGPQLLSVWQKVFTEKIREFYYWYLTTKIQGETSRIKRFVLKIKRKFR